MALTKADIKALKTADRINFIYDKVKGSVIRAVKEMENNPWEKEKVHEIYLLNSHFYTKADPVECFFSIHHANVSRTWQTIAEQLKAGDEIILEWIDNRSTILEKAGLYHDELKLRVHRETKRGRKVMSYIVGSLISHVYNLRMIK